MLKDFISMAGIYVVGCPDRDSEGLLVLTSDGTLQARLAQPGKRIGKIYYVQVEDEPTAGTLVALRNGITLNDGPTLPAGMGVAEKPARLRPHDPPIHKRKSTPTCWLEVTLYKGYNCQMHRVAAHVGFPALRLIHHAMGGYTLSGLANDEWHRVE